MRVVGQSFAVTIAVDDKFVTITGKIPLMLSAFANPARQFVERHGALLLQKPGGR